MRARLSIARTRCWSWWTLQSGLRSDAWLYGASALFALVLGWTSGQAAQWQWGYLAFGPYATVAVAALVASRLRLRRELVARLVLLAVVLVGAFAVPLALEARWRQAQPEVSVISRAGTDISKGINPYVSYVRHGHLVNAVPGVPAYQSFFPYFPLMGVFGLPSADTHQSKELTDARIVMSLLTMLASGVALVLMSASREKKIRLAQVLVALPTGALFLATGGDDMPILALLLLGVVGLQRRQNNLAGISIGLAAAMKLTAWPLAVGALLVAYGEKDRSAWRRIAGWCAAIVLVTVAPFAIRAPWAFFSNVFEFPLGLAGVASPAASALPWHILTTIWSPAGHILTPLTLLVGGYFAVKYVRGHWPLDLSTMLKVLSVSFAVMMCAASATRIGYLIYPLNFAMWAWALQSAPVEVPVLV